VSAYDKIRNAIRDGLYLDNLQLIMRTSYRIIEEDTPKHPAVFFALATLSRWGVDSWGDEVIPVGRAGRIEQYLKPHLQALIDVVDADAAEVCAVLDRSTSDFYKYLPELPER